LTAIGDRPASFTLSLDLEFAMFARLKVLRCSTAVVLTVLLLVQTTGCTSWHPVVTANASQSAADPSVHYRVTTRAETVMYLQGVHYRNDSIFGLPVGENSQHELALPLAAVATVEKEGANPVGSVALAAGLIGLVAIIASGISGTGSGGGGGWSAPTTGTSTMGLGSCPLVYSWDGSNWHLDSGTFGGAITPALARTDFDNLIYARAKDGLLRFRMTDEAEETEHVDAFTVVAVDHPAGTDVAPDARANNTFHVIGALNAPRVAHDFMGRDVLAMVRATDARTWESTPDGRDPANPAHLRDGLDLTFTRPAGGNALQLVVDAQNTEWSNAMMKTMVNAFGRLTAPWYDTATSAAASAPMARAQHGEGFLQVSVWNGTAWRSAGEIWEAGPEVAKRQVLPIDVSGIAGDSIRVRLESAPSFWRIDYVGLGRASTVTAIARDLPTVSVSAPHVSDGLARLTAKDGRFLDMEQNDTVQIAVRDTAHAPAHGMVRSYLSRTSGWYRIHGLDNAAPDMATLTALAGGVHAPARLAVMRMNAALEIVRARGTNAPRR
jgi:hypothetical protein